MHSRRLLTASASVLLVGLTLASCSDAEPEATGTPTAPASSASQTPEEKVVVSTNVGRRDVAVDEVVRVSASGGSLQRVRVSSPDGDLPGQLGDDGTWVAEGRLEPGTTYVVEAVSTTPSGDRQRATKKFSTADLTLDEQTFASVAPLDGETVGIGMPVVVTFDVPVKDKASMEEHMSVTSAPAQKGSWRWLSDYEAHWRPARYWQAGTDVTVDLDINSVSAGAGIYGQEDRHVEFHVGDAHVYKVDAQTLQMRVFSNGNLLRTLPVTTGKPGFTTRSGVKVIIEKFDSRRMRSETVGIPEDSAEGYDIDDVQWAMRLTWSGEFIHSAPWSVASQGVASVSHGCTGMSPANAKWLYDMTLRGDVVEYTGTDRPMTLTNGYGDWNTSFADYASGSALS